MRPKGYDAVVKAFLLDLRIACLVVGRGFRPIGTGIEPLYVSMFTLLHFTGSIFGLVTKLN